MEKFGSNEKIDSRKSSDIEGVIESIQYLARILMAKTGWRVRKTGGREDRAERRSGLGVNSAEGETVRKTADASGSAETTSRNRSMPTGRHLKGSGSTATSRQKKSRFSRDSG
jgi:hypothetical protein